MTGIYGGCSGLNLRRQNQPRYYAKEGYFDPFDEPKFGVDVLRGPYAAPRLGGKKFLGLNIVPRPTDDGNGPPVSPSVMYEYMYDLFTEGASGVTWLQWMKPQIDAAKLVGCNCVRLYFDCMTMVGDVSHMVPARTINPGLPEEMIIPAVTYKGVVSWAQMADAIQNICEYLASQNMYFYPTATECQPVDYVTEAGLLDYIDHFIAEIIKYPNVIACDVIMEVDRCLYTQTAANVATVMNRARAARGTSTMPLTCSISSIVLNNAGWKANLQRVVAAGVDFLDGHIYVSGSWQTVMDYMFENDMRLPVAVGEAGLTYSGAMFFDPGAVAQEVTHPKSSELRAQNAQDILSAWGRRFDLQVYTPYGVTDQWPHDSQRWGFHSNAQDANYRFTTEYPEKTNPLRTISHEPELTSNPWVLDLTGANTTAETLTTFAIGWAQLDFSGTFSRDSNKIKRVNGATTAGLINEYSLKSIDETVIIGFNAADGVATGGIINWSVGLRVQDGATDYYLITLTSSPGTPATDGLLTVYRAPDFTLLGSATLAAPVINLTHVYRLTASAIGTYPTALTITVFDVTAAATVATLSISDASPRLQSEGVTSLPSQAGTVYFTSLSVEAPGARGVTFDARPTLTNLLPTSGDLSWAASGGIGPYRYIPQYIALDSNGIPGTAWTVVGSASGQTATTVSITGLSAGTSYAFRVQVIDDALMAA